MFIEIRTVGDNKKYYLVHSFRKNGEVKKLRLYLGLNLSKKQVDDKRKAGEEVLLKRLEETETLRDPYSTVLSSKEIKELENIETEGTIKIKHLDEEEWERFTEDFTYDTNAIEGSSVTENEVINILQRNEHPTKRSNWEISETKGVAEAIKYIRKTKEHVSLDLIKKLHEIVFKDSKSFAGEFRTKGTEVVVVDQFGQIVHRGAKAIEVIRLLNDLIKWYVDHKGKLPALVLAAVVHNQFENIHPFADGNGRVGRLLLNNILIKNDKPPINIELENRREYYNALREYEHNGNIRPTLDLILKEYKRPR